MTNNNNESTGNIRPSHMSGKASKAKLVPTAGHVTATVNGPTELNSVERDARFDQAVAATRGLRLSEASVNHTIRGNKVYDTNTQEFIGEFGTSNITLTPSIRNSALKNSGRVGSPTLNRVEPSQKSLGERTSFIPTREVESEPATSVAPGSDVDKRLTAIETALAALLEASSK